MLVRVKALQSKGHSRAFGAKCAGKGRRFEESALSTLSADFYLCRECRLPGQDRSRGAAGAQTPVSRKSGLSYPAENPAALSCHIVATWLLWVCFLSWNLSLRFSRESEDHHQVPREFSTKAPLLCLLKTSATATWKVPTLEQENGA